MVDWESRILKGMGTYTMNSSPELSVILMVLLSNVAIFKDEISSGNRCFEAKFSKLSVEVRVNISKWVFEYGNSNTNKLIISVTHLIIV